MGKKVLRTLDQQDSAIWVGSFPSYQLAYDVWLLGTPLAHRGATWARAALVREHGRRYWHRGSLRRPVPPAISRSALPFTGRKTLGSFARADKAAPAPPESVVKKLLEKTSDL